MGNALERHVWGSEVNTIQQMEKLTYNTVATKPTVQSVLG